MILKKCSMAEFDIRTKGKKIICYGAGNELARILRNYYDSKWIDRIEYIADSDDKKSGTIYTIDSFSCQIISKDKLISLDVENITILVTSTAYVEIVEQLNSVRQLGKTECYIYHFMFGISDGLKISIKTTNQMFIPRVIHYCWFGYGEMPDLYKRCIESWHKLCPDYEINEWNEDNCNINEVSFTQHAYEQKKYGFVPDYFRLKIIYENGGIYLDTDVELLKSLDDLCYNRAFIGMQFPGEVALGLGFGAIQGNSMICEMMDWYKRTDFFADDETRREIPSPEIQSLYMHQHGMRYGNKMQIVDDVTIYPIEVLSPKNVSTHELNISPYTYAIHHYDGSWTSGARKDAIHERIAGVNRLNRLFV